MGSEMCIRDRSYSTLSNAHSRNQVGDFLLEQKVQWQKLIAPKGNVEKSTLQRISRSIDKLDKIYDNASSLLTLGTDTRPRVILLSEEIMEWRAVLRYSKFLEYKD